MGVTMLGTAEDARLAGGELRPAVTHKTPTLRVNDEPKITFNYVHVNDILQFQLNSPH